jgi:hypothetical protein
MSGTTRAFFVVGLVALVVAALLHLLVQIGLIGLWTAVVHLTIFGWITAMILGVSYHTMPVFSGRHFPYPRLTQAHCTAFSVGIVLTTAGLLGTQDSLVIPGLALEVVAALLFVTNVVLLFKRGVLQPGGPPQPPVPGQSEVDRVGSLATRIAGLSLPCALLLLLGVYTDVLSVPWVLAAEHLATLGWIMLMIVGVAVHVLPRFSGHGSRGAAWARITVSMHLLALLVMTPALGFGWTWLFAVGATIMAGAIALFAWTIWPAIVVNKPRPLPIRLSLKGRSS